jgi:tetratricopeptide (TPR) repeat protein
LVLSLVALGGCKKDPQVPVAAAPQLSGAEALNETSDPEVRAAQARVKASPSPEAWLLLAESWLRHARVSGTAGDLLSAEAAASKAQALGAKNAAGVRALTLLNQRRFEEARALAEATLVKEPEDLRSLAALADALLELGRLEESGRAVQKMIDLKPNLPSYSRASWLRWLIGDVAGAKQLIRLALDAGRDPRDPEPRAWTLCQAASYFWNEGDYEGAEAGYDQALALVADYPPALVGKARSALAGGHPDRALPLVTTAFTHRPTVDAGILRARVLEALKDASAEEAWQAAADQGKRGDRLGLGWLYALRNQNLEQAKTLLEKERAGRPGPYVLDALGWALFRSGRLEEGEEAAIGANRFGTQDARLWYHLGAIRLARGQVEGRALIEKALKLNPAWDWAEAADARRLLGGP